MFCTQCGAQNHPEAKFCSECGASTVVSVTHVTHVSPMPSSMGGVLPYAGFWFRTLAAVIDGVLIQVAALVLVLPLAFSMGVSMADSATPESIEAAGGAIGFLVAVLVQWLWFTVAESSSWQGSLGKKMLGLKVTNEQGGRIGFGEANVRYWSKILSAMLFCIGFLMVAFTNRKQGLHDKIARTLVIKTST